tara:strand:+ start:653 stop:1015 length:363 start_codon:yes stop_codon:yes gene_type:complete
VTRKYKAIKNSYRTLTIASNLLTKNFTATTPNQKWDGDATYLTTDEGWLYLVVLIDLNSRKVIDGEMNERMTTDLASDALKMALWSRKMPRNVIVRSDRDSQYRSIFYQSLMIRYDLHVA